MLVTVVDNALKQQLTTGAGRSVPNVGEKVREGSKPGLQPAPAQATSAR